MIKNALQNLDIKEADFSVEHPEDLKNGDYSTNVALISAKKLKINPKKLAEKIVSTLREAQGEIPEIKEIPYPEAPAGAPAHEGKPYRDPHLYVQCPAAQWPVCAALLKNNPQLDFDFLTMVTALDYMKPVPMMEMVYQGCRFVLAGRNRYRIVYKIASSQLIEIVSVRHCRRQMGLRVVH